MISAGVFLFLKYNIVNIKIILFFIGPIQQFFNNYLFLKFINKCQKEILRCAPLSSHVCDFLYYRAEVLKGSKSPTRKNVSENQPTMTDRSTVEPKINPPTTRMSTLQLNNKPSTGGKSKLSDAEIETLR